MSKKWITIAALIGLLFLCPFAMAQSGVEHQSFTVSSGTSTSKVHQDSNSTPSVNHTLELVWSSTPTNPTVTVYGCMIGTTCTQLVQSTSTSNNIVTFAGVYDYYVITSTYTGTLTLTENITGSVYAPSSASGSTVTANQGGTWNIATVTNLAQAGGSALSVDANGGLNVNIHGAAGATSNVPTTLATAIPAGSNLIGGVKLTDSAGTNQLGIDANHVLFTGQNFVPSDTQANASGAWQPLGYGGAYTPIAVYPFVYDGSTNWPRLRGTTTGVNANFSGTTAGNDGVAIFQPKNGTGTDGAPMFHPCLMSNDGTCSRWRSASNGNNISSTGIAVVGPYGQYNTATQSITATQYSVLQVDARGNLLVSLDHVNRFSCKVAVSTATTIQAVGGSCVAPGAGLSLYITDISANTNASGIAADSYMTLKSGTGGTCGTGTAIIWDAFTPAAAQTNVNQNLATPIKVAANSEICWINTTAGSKTWLINGYIAP